MTQENKPLETAMNIMRLAKLPPGYEPAILPVGFIDAVKALVKAMGEQPMEKRGGRGADKAQEHYEAYREAKSLMDTYNLLFCLAPVEWERTKSRSEELREIMTDGEEDTPHV